MMFLLSAGPYKDVVTCNSCNKGVTMKLPAIGCAIEGGSTVHACMYISDV